MNYAARVKETTTATSAAVITLLGAVSPMRSFATAFAVGTANIAITVADTAGKFEDSLYTLTNATTLTRTAIIDSSNGGLAETFAAGTKDVFCTAFAKQIQKMDNGTSKNAVYTSSVCVSDADVSLGSTNFGTDQRAKLQAILDLALLGPLRVIWDGAYGVSPDPVITDTALRIHSNTEIVALPGCGAILRGNAESSVLSNANRNDGRTGNAANGVGNKNISIIGGSWNGAGVAPSNLQLFGVDGVFLKGIKLLNSGSFHLHAGNWRNFVCEDVYVNKGDVSAIHNDGLHFCGPGQYLHLKNTTVLGCGDDNIALNADDAWVGNTRSFQPRGPITDVVIDGLNMVSNLYGIRILSGGSRVDNISINDVRGSTKGYWLVIDNFQPAQTLVSGPGNIGSVSISDVDMDTAAGGVLTACAVIDCKVEQLTLSNIRRAGFLNSPYASIQFGAKADIGQLSIDGYKSYPFGGGTSLAGQILFLSGSKVASAMINGSMFDAPSAVAGYPIVVQSGAVIGRLVVANNMGSNFSGFVSNAGTVTNLYAPESANFMNVAAAPPAASNWTLQEATHYSENVGANSLTFTGPYPGVVSTARRAATDAFGGNVQVSSKVRFSGTPAPALVGALFVRAANSIPLANLSAGVLLSFNMHTSPRSVRLNTPGGTDTTLNSAGLALDADYIATLTVKNTGTTIRETASVKRVSDNFYIQPDGTFAATVANCFDRTRTGSQVNGEYGVYSYAESAATIVFTDFAAVAAP